MIPRFSFVRPQTLPEAWDAFARTGGDAAWIAGGTELLQVMKMGLAQFGSLIDVKAIPDLHGIRRDADGAVIVGARSTHRAIERSDVVRDAIPAFAMLEAEVANVRVRNTGTIGGNLAFAEPHSDPATFLLVCGATVRLAGPDGRRDLPIEGFVLGPLFTARQQDELILDIRIPAAGPGVGRGYAKLALFERPAASAAVQLTVRAGAVTDVRVAVGSLTEIPSLVAGAGAALEGSEARSEALDERLPAATAAFGELDVVADINGSAEYKRHLAGVLLRRAVAAALTEATARA